MKSEHDAEQNGNRKVFNLVPAEDTRTRIIIEARTAALEDGDLDFGARCLFCRLLDLSLSYYTNRADGVVCISVTKLAELLKCASRTVYDWTQELIKRRHVWVSIQKMPNMWPMNTYHIWVLDPPDEARQMPTRDGLWGNGIRRDQPARGEGARPKPLNKDQGFSEPKTPILPENAGESGSAPLLSTANNAVENRKKCVGEPQTMRLATAEKDSSQPQTMRLGHAKNSRRQQQPAADNKETKLRDQSVSSKGEAPPIDPDWLRRVKKAFPKELEAMKWRLEKQQREADPSDLALVASLAARVEIVSRQLDGGPVPVPRQKAKPARRAPAIERPPTPEEVLEGARYLVSIGQEQKLTGKQREALAKSGWKGGDL